MRSNRFLTLIVFLGITLVPLMGAYAQSTENVEPVILSEEPSGVIEPAPEFMVESPSGILPAPEPVEKAAIPETPMGTVPLTASITLSNSRYTLGKDDVIDIAVMRHPEVSGQFIINAEGNIQYEFIGDLKVEGYTKDEVKDVITKKLSEYIINPEVTVKITGYNSKIIYVVGEVGAPGKIFMRGDTITVHEALMLSGLPLLTAANKRSLLITPATDGNAVQRKVDVEALLYKGDLRENLVMNPGDTLYIPPTFLSKTMRAISPITQPIGAAAGTGRTVTTGF